jgi:hypothetical protein
MLERTVGGPRSWLIDSLIMSKEETSQNLGHQRAYWSSSRWYVERGEPRKWCRLGGNSWLVHQSSLAVLPADTSGSDKLSYCSTQLFHTHLVSNSVLKVPRCVYKRKAFPASQRHWTAIYAGRVSSYAHAVNAWYIRHCTLFLDSVPSVWRTEAISQHTGVWKRIVLADKLINWHKSTLSELFSTPLKNCYALIPYTNDINSKINVVNWKYHVYVHTPLKVTKSDYCLSSLNKVHKTKG